MDAIEKGVNEMRDKKGGGGGANKDLRYMRIDGSTPAQQRQSYVNAFQEDEHCRVRGRTQRGG
jgi:SNF2 family DNA or RNA helicase